MKLFLLWILQQIIPKKLLWMKLKEIKILKRFFLKANKISKLYNSSFTIVYLPSYKRYLVNEKNLYHKHDLIKFFNENDLDYFDADIEVFSKINFKKIRLCL